MAPTFFLLSFSFLSVFFFREINSRAIITVAAEEHGLSPVVPEPIPLKSRDVAALGIVGLHTSLEVLQRIEQTVNQRIWVDGWRPWTIILLTRSFFFFQPIGSKHATFFKNYACVHTNRLEEDQIAGRSPKPQSFFSPLIDVWRPITLTAANSFFPLENLEVWFQFIFSSLPLRAFLCPFGSKKHSYFVKRLNSIVQFLWFFHHVSYLQWSCRILRKNSIRNSVLQITLLEEGFEKLCEQAKKDFKTTEKEQQVARAESSLGFNQLSYWLSGGGR